MIDSKEQSKAIYYILGEGRQYGLSSKNDEPHHRSVVSRPGLVKDRFFFCCSLVPADLPESTAVRGSGSGSGGSPGRPFLWRDKGGRVRMGLPPQTLGQLMSPQLGFP